MEDVKDDIAYSFNGEGYAVRNRVSSGPYNKYSFGVSISFRTYDENALLFLAINPDNVRDIHISFILSKYKFYRVSFIISLLLPNSIIILLIIVLFLLKIDRRLNVKRLL